MNAAVAGCAGNGRGPSGEDCPPSRIGEGGVCDIHISLDSVGFLPARVKEATLAGVGPAFVVHRTDGTEVMSGMARGPVTSDADLGGVYIADFSAISETGDYYVEAGDDGAKVKSASFHIGADAYDATLHTLMLGMYSWRCGADIRFSYAGHDFYHGKCHTNDAYKNYLNPNNVNMDTSIKPSLYGWHDAGDYGKYVTNGAFSLGMFLEAWELFPESLGPLALPIPEHGGPLPDYLAEMKWELDWLLTTQFSDGSVSHKVTALNFESLGVAPEGDGSQRFFAPAGTAATAELVAVAAMASRIYAPYDAAFATTCLQAAQLSYQYLQAHTANQRPNLGAFMTGAYQMDDTDPRLWAAVELWEATGDPAVLRDAEARLRNRGVLSNWDWGNPGNLGVFSYLISKREGRDPASVDRLTTQLRSSADTITGNAERHAYGRSFGNYFWGSNGSIVRNVMNLQFAYKLFGDLRYLDASVRQIDHLLGRNVYGRSQVTGVGANPPQSPHHRPSIAYGYTFPGLVVGGAWPTARSWVDNSGEFNTNEVAINWNAALVFALAGFTSATDRGIVGLDAGSDAPIVSDAGDETEASPVDAPSADVSVSDAQASEAAPDVSIGDVSVSPDVSVSSDGPLSPGDEADAGAPGADASTQGNDAGAQGTDSSTPSDDASTEVTPPDGALDDGTLDDGALDDGATD